MEFRVLQDSEYDEDGNVIEVVEKPWKCKKVMAWTAFTVIVFGLIAGISYLAWYATTSSKWNTFACLRLQMSCTEIFYLCVLFCLKAVQVIQTIFGLNP